MPHGLGAVPGAVQFVTSTTHQHRQTRRDLPILRFLGLIFVIQTDFLILFTHLQYYTLYKEFHLDVDSCSIFDRVRYLHSQIKCTLVGVIAASNIHVSAR